jgi:hypothetical protein
MLAFEVSSRATRLLEIEVFGIAAERLRVTSSKVQDAEPPPAAELVIHEVERPARIRAGFH